MGALVDLAAVRAARAHASETVSFASDAAATSAAFERLPSRYLAESVSPNPRRALVAALRDDATALSDEALRTLAVCVASLLEHPPG